MTLNIIILLVPAQPNPTTSLFDVLIVITVNKKLSRVATMPGISSTGSARTSLSIRVLFLNFISAPEITLPCREQEIFLGVLIGI